MKIIQIKDIINYLKININRILLSGAIGFIIGLSYCLYMPTLYESHFTLMLGKIDSASGRKFKNDRIGQEIPFILDAQRAFSSPDLASDQIIQGCGYPISNESRKIFIKSIEIIRSPDNQQLLVRVRIPEKERALKCAVILANNALESYQNRQKQILAELMAEGPGIKEEDFIIRAPGINGMLLVSDGPVWPNYYRMIFGFMLFGIIGFLYASWVWNSIVRKLKAD
jgi:hypothetical protein